MQQMSKILYCLIIAKKNCVFTPQCNVPSVPYVTSAPMKLDSPDGEQYGK